MQTLYGFTHLLNHLQLLLVLATSTTQSVGDVVLIVDTDAPAVTVSFVISNSAGVVDLASGTAVGNV